MLFIKIIFSIIFLKWLFGGGDARPHVDNEEQGVSCEDGDD